MLKWDSLELRRKYFRLIQMYKIFFDSCDIDCHTCIYFDIVGNTHTRSNHGYEKRPKDLYT